MTTRLDGGFLFKAMADLYKNPHYKYRRFYNHAQEKVPSFLFKSCSMYLRSWRQRTQSNIMYKQSVLHLRDTCSLLWIGHATFLIKLDSIAILTDPIFGSPSLLFPRIKPPAKALEQLGNVDFVLISHNHRDHMDAYSLYGLQQYKPHHLVPQGVGAWFEKRNFFGVQEFGWWQQQTFYMPNGNKIIFTFLPAHHWSQRGIFDKNKTLWGSWMIEYEGLTIYFAGDTAYATHFAAIGNAWQHIDVALLPIAPCQPHEWLKHSHMDARQAVQAFVDLDAQYFFPMHWGTFRFGIDPIAFPLAQLKEAWQTCAVDADKILLLPAY